MLTIPQQVIDAIIATKTSPLAKEQAAAIVEAWIARFEEEDRKLKIVDVERPWYEWLNENTLAVGVNDLVLEDGFGEWKTIRPPRKKRNGDYYDGEGPDNWAKKLAASIQVSIYARKDTCTNFLVRAAVKSSPPDFWQYNIAVDAEQAMWARHAFIVQADLIRAVRLHSYPWRFKDGHKIYNRACLCAGEINVTQTHTGLISADDPGAEAVKAAIGDRLIWPGLVVLSASAYETSVQCLEAYRRTLLGAKEDSEALDIGTACHAGWAEWYRYLKSGG
ncbi:MAG TPA: hypothetical protein VFI60_05795 [Candidatus Acidoferrum sp.]|nr:hypothetical protein [Candidatus Acidoferrum sp.]